MRTESPTDYSATTYEASLGSLFRDLRHAYGDTVKQVARRSGLSIRMVERIEAGDTSVRLSSIIKLCESFGLEMSVELIKAKANTPQ